MENTPLTSCKNSLLLPLNSHISRRSLLRWKDSSCSVSAGEVRNLLYQEGVEKALQRSRQSAPQCSGLGVQGPGGSVRGPTPAHRLLGYQNGPHSRPRWHTAGSWAQWFAGRVKNGVAVRRGLQVEDLELSEPRWVH